MTCVRTWIRKKILNKMENKELEEKSSPIDSAKQVTTTEKKKNQKIQEELQLEKNLLSIKKRLVVKIKKFQKKTKMKFQKNKDHFH